MKSKFCLVLPASAAIAAVLISATGCAGKQMPLPDGAFDAEPAQKEPASQIESIPQRDPLESIYITNNIPVGPVDDGQGTEILPPPITTDPLPKATAPGGSVEYKVVKGDSLWGIGMVYGVSAARLAEVNNLDPKAPLKVGRVLMIPPDAKNAVGKPIPQKKAEPKKAEPAKTTTAKPSTKPAAPTPKAGEKLYVVKNGDSLSVIAHRNHVKLADLVSVNKIDQKATLRIGQTLILPPPNPALAKSNSASSATKPATTASKPAPAATVKPAETVASSTKPDATPAAKPGEGSGAVIEPLDKPGTAASTPAVTTPAASSGSGLAPVGAADSGNEFSVPIDAEMTLEEVAKYHDRDLQSLIKLNPNFAPGQKIPAGTSVKMPLF